MLTRRAFLATLTLAPVALALGGFSAGRLIDYPKGSLSKFSMHLKPVGRALPPRPVALEYPRQKSPPCKK